MRFGWIEEPPFNFRNPDREVADCDVDDRLAVAAVPAAEKPADVVAFALQDKGLCSEVNVALGPVLTSAAHQHLMQSPGIDLPN